VVAQRLRDEYKVECAFEPVSVATARWIECGDDRQMQKFRDKAYENLAVDQSEELVYIAPTRVNLQMAQERFPEVEFHATREH
jgi:peptide chain release factor 3